MRGTEVTTEADAEVGALSLLCGHCRAPVRLFLPFSPLHVCPVITDHSPPVFIQLWARLHTDGLHSARTESHRRHNMSLKSRVSVNAASCALQTVLQHNTSTSLLTHCSRAHSAAPHLLLLNVSFFYCLFKSCALEKMGISDVERERSIVAFSLKNTFSFTDSTHPCLITLVGTRPSLLRMCLILASPHFPKTEPDPTKHLCV